MNVMLDDVTLAQWEWDGEQRNDDPEHSTGWNYNDIRTVVERVNRGAQLLDEEEPGWREKVIPDKLDMKKADFCIIGQVYGNYDEYIGVPFGMGASGRTGRQAIDHGFLTQCKPSGDEYEGIPYELLDYVWVSLIAARAATGERVFLNVPPQLPRNRMLSLVRAEAVAA